MNKILQNINYPLLLRKDNFITLNFNNYKLNSNPSISYTSENIYKLPFTFLNYSVTNPIYIGVLNMYDNNILKYYSIDTLINKSVLQNLGNYYAEKTIDDYSNNNLYINLTYKNFYDVLKFTKIFASNNITYKDSLTKYSDLYDTDFSKYIYRAKYNLTKTIINGESKIFYPIFSVESSHDDLECFVYIRNIPIYYKKFITSYHNNKYNYIFIYPEYLLTNQQQYIDSIQKIKFNYSENIVINYSYLKDQQLIPNITNKYTDMRNTFSNITYF